MNKFYIIAIALVLTVILVFFLVWPKYEDWQVLQDIIEKKQKELQSKTDHFAAIREISQELEIHEEALTKIASGLVKDPSLPVLFNYLQETASESGLILKAVSFEEMMPREMEPITVKEVHLTLSLTGSYTGFKSFLTTIENSVRLFKIQNITFSSPEYPEELFSFQVKLKTYGY